MFSIILASFGQIFFLNFNQKVHVKKTPKISEFVCIISHVLHFSYLLTYLLTPWNRVLLEKLTGPQLAKKSPTFYGNGRSLPGLQVPVNCPYPEQYIVLH